MPQYEAFFLWTDVPKCQEENELLAFLFDSLYYLHFQAFWMVFYGGRSSAGRALVCESSCRGFEPRRSPHNSSFLSLQKHFYLTQGAKGNC